MTDQNKNRRYEDSPEQKIKEKDNQKDIDPQREQVDAKKNKESEKNPDDFEQ
ncbi:hypothetical protein [Thalassobacillus devorans]|uniref:hypothetical protein n=1 Tax=Thalassobacillus devorans TaxID=279813 RepID=UPI0015939BA7|nr:hypothetical protein [Thalassobacillus devorans]